MDHAKKDKELDKEELAACCKKLESYVEYFSTITLKKSLSPKEIKGILQTILDMNFTFEALKNVKIGPILKPINKEESTDPDYAAVKKLINQITEKAKQLKGSEGSSKNTETGKPTSKTPESEKNPILSTINLEGMDVLPKLEDSTRNYILSAFVKEMLIDFKSDPKGLEANKRFANKAAFEIEDYLFNKMNKDIQGKYRTEAMSLIAYIKEKTNTELRNDLLSGSNVKKFVDNKESFISEAAKERRLKAERAILDANNADYHKKMVTDSLIYSCRKCKSKKILKEEKQIRGGDEPMTSFFTCLECGSGWREG